MSCEDHVISVAYQIELVGFRLKVLFCSLNEFEKVLRVCV